MRDKAAKKLIGQKTTVKMLSQIHCADEISSTINTE